MGGWVAGGGLRVVGNRLGNDGWQANTGGEKRQRFALFRLTLFRLTLFRLALFYPIRSRPLFGFTPPTIILVFP
jgi:hypothetical protein